MCNSAGEYTLRDSALAWSTRRQDIAARFLPQLLCIPAILVVICCSLTLPGGRLIVLAILDLAGRRLGGLLLRGLSTGTCLRLRRWCAALSRFRWCHDQCR